MAINGALTTVRMLRNENNDGTEANDGDVATVQADGSVDFEAPAGGPSGWTHIATIDEASLVSSIDLAAVLDDTYESYMLVLERVVMQLNSQELWMRVEVAAAFVTTNYEWVFNRKNSSAETKTSSTSSSHIEISPTDLSLVTDARQRGVMYLHRPLDADSGWFETQGSFVCNGGSRINICEGAGRYKTGGANVTGIQLLAASGTLSGRMRLYGLVD